jgi:pimeloyl-ACP methyl ester carboxylesterase
MATDIVEPRSGEARGFVILMHGLAANKKIMAYLAQAFAETGLRVFVPDLPGHGRTNEPFSFAQAEACSESLLGELIARGTISPTRTILAGHSMGGAMAIRIAARVPVAAVIAVSPAPMRATHGIPATLLPFHIPPVIPAKTLVISASFEPLGIREAARDLISTQNVTSKYWLIPNATHVSVLFDRRVASAAENWAAEAIGLPSPTVVPPLRALSGSFLGFAGILFFAGPFLKAIFARPAVSTSQGRRAKLSWPRRYLLEVAVASAVVITILKFWVPLSFVHLFNGAYFASFLLLVGIALLLLHSRDLRAVLHARLSTLLAAGLAGLALHLAVSGWIDATLSETWLSAARWLRFPALLVAALPYLLWEESMLEPTPSARLIPALSLRLIAEIWLLFGIFVLHSGAILLFLLLPYLAVFSLLHCLGMGVVRKHTGSVAVAALFGAILLTGFCLMIFPVS